jgi:hypothetical protein
VTEPQAERYAPDPHGLWLLYADIQRTGNRLERMARWRMDVTPPGEGFPELVLTMDRRMA